ncbi:sodium/proton antiporter, CPA1 family [Chitinophaga sp. YR627]|uniref:Na+/H+ antiporter n=1 Tax=Chitinophaga sp. YR627 TaxID=1881041 RepID=UPI0008DF16B8|nr:Na+/H+ antiporter [Chitinophaga sp. YR627]SFO48711.1 sodium/proton antiporter, CPA1 family [Chitinophaga sp. YR627]
MHSTFVLYIGLLLVLLVLVMLAQRLKISYPIVLVLGGLALSLIPGLPDVSIDPELIFLLFLPPLLYDAAWNTSWKEFWKWRRVISSFAFGIILLTSCVIAVVSSSLIPGFTLALGFLLGGIISPPDAVSATTVMRGLDVPRRLLSIIEGESLMNDAASLIVYRFALAAVLTGSFTFHEAALSFVVVIVMGIVTGLVIALIFYAIHRWTPTTASMDTVLTFVAPYVMYIVAETFHFSGVLAVVSGGLFMSSRQQTILSHLSRLQGVNVWATVGFVLNGIVFMLIGLELPVIVSGLGESSLKQAIWYGLIISAVVIVTRILCTQGASIFTVFISRFIKTADNKPGWKLPLVFGWAGMRGVVSLAAALSIPIMAGGQPFPQRNMILFITFVVILVTLVLQGLTLPWLIRKLGLEEVDYMSEVEQDTLIRKKLTFIAVQLLDSQYKVDVEENELIRQLRATMENEYTFLESYAASHATDINRQQAISRYRIVFNELIHEQREMLRKINKKAEFDEEIVRKHMSLLDLAEEKITQQYK